LCTSFIRDKRVVGVFVRFFVRRFTPEGRLSAVATGVAISCAAKSGWYADCRANNGHESGLRGEQNH
jgi:hypothetical protein